MDNKLVGIQDLNYAPTIDIHQLLKNPDIIDETTKQQIQVIIDNTLSSYAHDYLITQTNAFAKEAIISQAVAGLARYFDTTTDDKYTSDIENYASDFDLSDDGNIDIQNNVLNISGKMYGQIVHFFYNLETGEIQANDYLYKVMEAQSFFINDPRGRVTLPTTLPSINKLHSQIQSINYQDMINNSNSRKTYQTKLQKQSNTKLSKNFDNNNYNKVYIQRMNEKNLFIQEALDTIDGPSRLLKIAGKTISVDNASSPIEITRSIHPNEYELLMILDRTSQIYRGPDQLRKIRDSINRWKQAIQNNRIANGVHSDPVIKKLFNQKALHKDTENRNNPGGKSNFLLFFDLISNPKNKFGGGVLDITLLQKVIDRIEKNKPIAMLENPKTVDYANDPRYFNEKYEKILNENI